MTSKTPKQRDRTSLMLDRALHERLLRAADQHGLKVREATEVAVYLLEDCTSEDVRRTFYESEIQKVLQRSALVGAVRVNAVNPD